MRLSSGLQSPKTGNLSENLPKVSGQVPRYSRFWETVCGDEFDLHWAVGLAGKSPLPICSGFAQVSYFDLRMIARLDRAAADCME